MDYKQIDDLYVAHTYARFPVMFTSGNKVTLTDVEGKTYLDFTSGIGVTGLGHNYGPWVDAVSKQAGTLAHISNLYYTKPMLDVATKLVAKTGLKKVFFANSGAEANEGMIKVARKYGNDKYNGSKNEIITLVNSFHGRTITTLMATGQDVFHHHFHPFTAGFDYSIANDLEDLLAKITDKTIGIMLEIVQGEGGVLPIDPEYCQKIQEICKEKDILLMIDEVQTGIGRTGKFLAYEHYGLHPDIVSLAKGLGNGLPIGAVLLGEKVEYVLGYGDHGTTFGGNPVACAGANVVLDTLTTDFLKEVEEKGNYIKSRLEKMPHVLSVAGLGMMLGVEFDNIAVKDLILKCIEGGAVFLSAKTKLRLLPPLVMTKEEIDQGLDILENILTNWEE